MFTGKSIYKRETVSNKNIGLVDRIRIYFNNRNGSSGLRLIDVDWSRTDLTDLDLVLELLPYMVDRLAHYGEKVGDTQQIHDNTWNYLIMCKQIRNA